MSDGDRRGLHIQGIFGVFHPADEDHAGLRAEFMEGFIYRLFSFYGDIFQRSLFFVFYDGLAFWFDAVALDFGFRVRSREGLAPFNCRQTRFEKL